MRKIIPTAQDTRIGIAINTESISSTVRDVTVHDSNNFWEIHFSDSSGDSGTVVLSEELLRDVFKNISIAGKG